eukprot:TRINITY_DN7833_c0_g1_i1.p1 TRINITY_DN7833_c0_g1~~TRINITY_DN7833_c0_g1_i1.p1  ORF type:complete len:435 (+),score=43.88 TRINITY_DN7833_c0_g1_i1:481-1785(+)
MPLWRHLRSLCLLPAKGHEGRGATAAAGAHPTALDGMPQWKLWRVRRVSCMEAPLQDGSPRCAVASPDMRHACVASSKPCNPPPAVNTSRRQSGQQHYSSELPQYPFSALQASPPATPCGGPAKHAEGLSQAAPFMAFTLVAHEGLPVFAWSATGNVQSDVGALAGALQGLGLNRGDGIGIACRDTEAWLVIDYAAAINEYMVVPVGVARGLAEGAPTPEEARDRRWAAEVRVVFCDDVEAFRRVLLAATEVGSVSTVGGIVVSGELANHPRFAPLGVNGPPALECDEGCEEEEEEAEEWQHGTSSSASPHLLRSRCTASPIPRPGKGPLTVPRTSPGATVVARGPSPYTTPPQERTPFGEFPVNTHSACAPPTMPRKPPRAAAAAAPALPPPSAPLVDGVAPRECWGAALRRGAQALVGQGWWLVVLVLTQGV